MHKKELIKKVTSKTKLPEKHVAKVIDTMISETASSLKRGRKVMLKGFGAFVIRKKKKRMIHNVNNGKMIQVPAHKSVVFEVGAPLKELVW